VQLVISDAHEGLRGALSQVFAGATWQRCKVHFPRNVASAVPKPHAPAVLAVVKSIFLQDLCTIRAQNELRTIPAHLHHRALVCAHVDPHR